MPLDTNSRKAIKKSHTFIYLYIAIWCWYPLVDLQLGGLVYSQSNVVLLCWWGVHFILWYILIWCVCHEMFHFLFATCPVYTRVHFQPNKVCFWTVQVQWWYEPKTSNICCYYQVYHVFAIICVCEIKSWIEFLKRFFNNLKQSGWSELLLYNSFANKWTVWSHS